MTENFDLAKKIESRIDDHNSASLSNELIKSLHFGSTLDIIPLLDSQNRSAQIEAVRILSESFASLTPILGNLKKILRDGDLILKRIVLNLISESPNIQSEIIGEMVGFYESADVPLKRSTRIWVLFSDIYVLEEFTNQGGNLTPENQHVLAMTLELKKGKISNQIFDELLTGLDPVFLDEFRRLNVLACKKGAIPQAPDQ